MPHIKLHKLSACVIPLLIKGEAMDAKCILGGFVMR